MPYTTRSISEEIGNTSKSHHYEQRCTYSLRHLDLLQLQPSAIAGSCVHPCCGGRACGTHIPDRCGRNHSGVKAPSFDQHRDRRFFYNRIRYCVLVRIFNDKKIYTGGIYLDEYRNKIARANYSAKELTGTSCPVVGETTITPSGARLGHIGLSAADPPAPGADVTGRGIDAGS